MTIPRELSRLIDEISAHAPRPFREAIPAGADLSRIWPRFAHWLIVDGGNGISGAPQPPPPEVAQAILNAAILFAQWIEEGEPPPALDWAQALEYAQHPKPLRKDERWPATPALWAAARMMRDPLDSARAAADVASLESGREATWRRFGDKLLELLRQVPAAAAA
jgi:hypothetical protein